MRGYRILFRGEPFAWRFLVCPDPRDKGRVYVSRRLYWTLGSARRAARRFVRRVTDG